MPSQLSIHAFAKINWGLELLGKRPDGYHEIRTITQTVSLCDDLRVAACPEGIALVTTGEWPAPDGPDNICWRAAQAFREAFGKPPGARIELLKRIPIGGGLGGGSSDCVAVLAALARLAGVDDPVGLQRIAAALGSDTVLFLTGGTALCSGRGEVVAPLPCPRVYDLVLAKPDCGVSTRDAYALIGPADLTDGLRMDALAAALAAGAEPRDLAPRLHNAFRARVSARFPEIAALIAGMLAAGAVGAEMTGSGSAIFGLAQDAAQAQSITQRLCAQGVWALAVRTVDRGFQIREGTDDE